MTRKPASRLALNAVFGPPPGPADSPGSSPYTDVPFPVANDPETIPAFHGAVGEDPTLVGTVIQLGRNNYMARRTQTWGGTTLISATFDQCRKFIEAACGQNLRQEQGALASGPMVFRFYNPVYTVLVNRITLTFTTTQQAQSWFFVVASGTFYTITWGDGSSTTTLGNGGDQEVAHNYSTGGTYTISVSVDPTKLRRFDCISNGLTGELPSFAACTVLEYFACNSNAFSGALPSFATCTALIVFSCRNNAFSGALPSFATCIALTEFECDGSAFSGALPSFGACVLLHLFDCHDNAFSGALPSFAACILLNNFYCEDNTFSGTLPSFNTCTVLTRFTCNHNTFSGTLPSFGTCVHLLEFNIEANAFTARTAGTQATTCNLWAGRVNALSQAAIDSILADFATNAAARPLLGGIYLTGGTNATPSAGGLASKAAILAAKPAWTIEHN